MDHLGLYGQTNIWTAVKLQEKYYRITSLVTNVGNFQELIIP